ncbi:hypothetical protein DFH09DRAFT_200624 [Mycena vulgaris]|nr:hypothetical protein DFH09DRAFT_200624 [Mycena vulgaris]
MLRACPNLVECTLEEVYYPLDFLHDTESTLLLRSPDILVLPHMQQFGNSTCYSNELILRYVSFPALQTLSLPFCDVHAADLVPFLRRSSPPLQKITMNNNRVRWTLHQIEECFFLLPALTHFEFFWYGHHGGRFPHHPHQFSASTPKAFRSQLSVVTTRATRDVVRGPVFRPRCPPQTSPLGADYMGI